MLPTLRSCILVATFSWLDVCSQVRETALPMALRKEVRLLARWAELPTIIFTHSIYRGEENT